MTLKKSSQNQTTRKANFPDLPLYSAVWCPIQIEPIVGSGEKITVAIAVKGNDGAVNVSKTAPQKVINCLTGSKEVGTKLSSLIQICIESATTHLQQRNTLNDWQSPIQSVTQGDSISALGKDINDIIWQASGLSSILGASSLASNNTKKEKRDLASWKADIKSSLKEKNKKIIKHLDIKIASSGSILNTTVDFLYHNHAIDFGLINNASIQNNYRRQFHVLQSRLWQLDRLRDIQDTDELFHIDNVCLMIQSAEKNDLIEEIKIEAKHRDILVTEVKKADEAASILQRIVTHQELVA